MLRSLHHVGVAVADMTRSLDFYVGKLGGVVGLDITVDRPEFGAGVGIPGAKARVVFMQIPEMAPQFELIQYISPAGKRTQNPSSIAPGTMHSAFQVADIRETYETLTQKGVRFISAPSTFPMDHPQLGGVSFCYFQDPDGSVLELIQLPQ